MNKKSITKNYVFDLVYRVICLIVPLITAPYISRVIGIDGIGDYSYTASISSYFCFFAILGSNVFGQREVASCGGDRNKVTTVFWNLFFIRLFFTLITLFVYIFFCQRSNGVIKVLLLLQTIDVVGQVFDITWLFQGLEEFGLILIRNIIMKSISVLSIFLFVHSPDDLYLYVGMMSFANVLSNIVLFFSLKKHVNRPLIKFSTMRSYILPIVKLFIPTITLNLYNQIDKSMLGAMSVSYEAGAYEQATKIITIVTTFVTSINNVMLPRMASLFQENEYKNINSLLQKSFDYIWFLALPVCTGLMVIADVFVPIFFGIGYEKVVVLLRILGIICIPMGIKTIIGMQILIPSKKEKVYTYSIFAGLVINILLNLVLIRYFASVGASIASVVSEFLILAFLISRVKHRIMPKIFTKNTVNKVIASIIMAILVIVIKTIFTNSFVSLILSITSGALFYFLILFLLKDSTVLFVLNKLLNVVNKCKS